jgi:hypothetical protein
LRTVGEEEAGKVLYRRKKDLGSAWLGEETSEPAKVERAILALPKLARKRKG